MCKVSLIIPVYNAEKYIEKCLDSVVKQDFKDFEAIVVNDGTKDNSVEIIEKYIRKYDFIKLFHKKNGGLSDARNFGIENSKGKYLMFLDSDDWIDSDMIRIMHDRVSSENAQMGFCDVSVDYENGELKELQIQGKNYPEIINTREHKNLFVDIECYACNKIFERSLFDENDIKFPVGMHYEDVATTPRLIVSSSKIIKIKRAFYHYIFRESSGAITRNFTKKSVLDYIKAIDIVDDYLIKNNLQEVFKISFKKFVVLNVYYSMTSYWYFIKSHSDRNNVIDKIKLIINKFGISKSEILSFERENTKYIKSKKLSQQIFLYLSVIDSKLLSFLLKIK